MSTDMIKNWIISTFVSKNEYPFDTTIHKKSSFSRVKKVVFTSDQEFQDKNDGMSVTDLKYGDLTHGKLPALGAVKFTQRVFVSDATHETPDITIHIISDANENIVFASVTSD